MRSLEIGDKIMFYLTRRKTTTKKQGNVVAITSRFVVVDTGMYRESLDLFDIKKGLIKIIKEANIMTEGKITREQLLEELNERGISKETIAEVAEKYSLSKNTISNYIRRWEIGKEFNPTGGTTSSMITKEECKGMVDAGKSIDEIAEHFGVPAWQAKGKLASWKLIKTNSKAQMPLLRPRVLTGKEMQYSFFEESLVIMDMGSSSIDKTIEMEIPWSYLSTYIKELQEVQDIAGKWGVNLKKGDKEE